MTFHEILVWTEPNKSRYLGTMEIPLSLDYNSYDTFRIEWTPFFTLFWHSSLWEFLQSPWQIGPTPLDEDLLMCHTPRWITVLIGSLIVKLDTILWKDVVSGHWGLSPKPMSWSEKSLSENTSLCLGDIIWTGIEEQSNIPKFLWLNPLVIEIVIITLSGQQENFWEMNPVDEMLCFIDFAHRPSFKGLELHYHTS